jgi:hypothetical protein
VNRRGIDIEVHAMKRCGFVLGSLALLWAVPSASAVITAKLPMRQIIDDATFICAVKVETIDSEKLGAIFVVDEDLQGKFGQRRLPVNLRCDKEGEKTDDTNRLLKRLAPRLTIMLFITAKKNEKNQVNSYDVLAYSNGTWFHLRATKAPEGEKTVFAFMHCEPYLRRSFKGTTEEMKSLVNDVLAGVAIPPTINDKEAPGLGPEVMEKKDSGPPG